MWIKRINYETLCRQQEIDRKEADRLRSENIRLDVEVCRLKERLAYADKNMNKFCADLACAGKIINRLRDELGDANCRLSKFERTRGDKGRFVKKQES